jgi:methyl-accepting chemotaxis protein
MSFPRSIAARTIGALAAPAALAAFASATFFPDDDAQRAAGFALVAAALAATALAALVALRVHGAPMAAALAVPPAERDHALRLRATTAALRLPARVALALFAAVAAGTLAYEVVELQLGMPGDVAVAVAAVGAACALMAAMIGYANAATGVASALPEVGAVEVAASGTLRGKIAVVAAGLLAIATLLVGATAYGRFRSDADRQQIAAAAAALQRAAAVASERDLAATAEIVRIATGASTLVVGQDGAVVARAGDAAPAPVGLVPTAPGHEAVPGGWRVWQPLARGGAILSFVPEAPLRDRRGAFWGDLVTLGAALLAASALLVWLAARSLTTSVSLLGASADRIAAGDLTASPPSVSRDELGQLAAHFRGMARGLSAIVADVRAATAGVGDGAREASEAGERVKATAQEAHARAVAVEASVEGMHASVGSMSRGVDALSDHVEAATSALGALTSSLEDARRQAHELEARAGSAGSDFERLGEAGRRAQAQLGSLDGLAASAQATLGSVSASLAGLETSAVATQLAAAQAAELSDRAGGVVQEAVAGIEGLRANVGETKKRVAVLGRRSDDVDQILDFIGEVAGRTNLLSLNASIIATQAGEHGKAFAVVADQIRELAAQISSSTKSIGEILRAVRDDVAGTARLIDRGDALAGEGVERARRSLEALHGIRVAAAKNHESAAGIRDAVQAHAHATRDVSSLVASVAEGSHALSEAIQGVGNGVAGVATVARGVGALADRLGRALEEQATAGRRQLETLERADGLLSDVGAAVENHDAAARRVREALAELGQARAQHDRAIAELSSVADRLGGRSRALADRVGKFKIELHG